MQPNKYNPYNHSGLFKHRISLYKKGAAPGNDSGFPDEEPGYELHKMVWAKARTMSARQYFSSGGQQNERTTLWEIRYEEGINDDMQVQYEGRTFEIENIITNDEAKRTLTLVCKEMT